MKKLQQIKRSLIVSEPGLKGILTPPRTMKRFLLMFLSVALLPLCPVTARAESVQSAQIQNIQFLQAQLQQQVCAQQWAEAIQTIDRLLASPIEWGLGQREQLIDYRESLVQYAQAGTHFDSVSFCGVAVSAEQWERAVSAVANGAGTSGRVTGGMPQGSYSSFSGSSGGFASDSFSPSFSSLEGFEGGNSSSLRSSGSFGETSSSGFDDSRNPTSDPFFRFRNLENFMGGGQSGGAGGSCNNPGDIAADGSRCGGRAASSRPGGR